MSLAHDGTNTHFDGSRAPMLIDTDKGGVLPIADQNQRLAIPTMGYDCAQQERTTTTTTVPLAEAPHATAVPSVELHVADPAAQTSCSIAATIVDQEVVEGQCQLLAIHRHRLSILLCQQARLGDHTPPYIAIDIESARAEIARIKAVLRGAGHLVADEPNDTPSATLQHLAPLSTQAWRNRSRMLAKVRDFWVKGVLENSLHGAALLALDIEERPNAVSHPWNMIVEQLDRSPCALPLGTRIVQVFDDLHGELLILGAPGAGKTTMLLELTRDLLDRAVQDEGHPIPVVFSLSSWAAQRPPLAAWLVDELTKRYDIPRKIGQAWVDADQILPLLDGLDEVPQERRAACVDAINSYRVEHSILPLVVCSRITDYEAQASRLRLQGAIAIQPLTKEQIDGYLASAGDQLTALRAAMERSAALYELAETPLLLSMMTLAYQGAATEEVSTQGSPMAWRDQLFAAYVRRMLARPRPGTHYHPRETIHWLTSLARNMVRHSQSVFYIEQLQPDWLPHRQHQSYKVGVTLACVFIFVLVGVVAGGLGGWLIDNLGYCIRGGLDIGLICGPLGGLVAGLAFGARGARAPIAVVEQLHWSCAAALSAVRNSLWYSLAVGLVSGLVFGLRFRPDIGPAIGPSIGPILGLTFYPAIGLGIGLVFGLSFALAIGLAFGLSATEIPLKATPNQGIRRSVRNALCSGLGIGLVEGLVFGLGFGLIFSSLKVGLGFGLAFGLGFAGLGWLLYGGLASLQHLILRKHLYCHCPAPWDYAQFLDYASDRILMRKVGGGYIFVHRMLMEYFATLETTPENEVEKARESGTLVASAYKYNVSS